MNIINITMINTINNKVFRNANEAYEYLHDQIIQNGVDFGELLSAKYGTGTTSGG